MDNRTSVGCIGLSCFSQDVQWHVQYTLLVFSIVSEVPACQWPFLYPTSCKYPVSSIVSSSSMLVPVMHQQLVICYLIPFMELCSLFAPVLSFSFLSLDGSTIRSPTSLVNVRMGNRSCSCVLTVSSSAGSLIVVYQSPTMLPWVL